MTKPELGTKRLCAGCDAKFYDLLKSPIVCPMCEAVFVVPKPAPSRPRRGFEPIAQVMPVVAAPAIVAKTTTRPQPAKTPRARRKPRTASRCWRSTRIDSSLSSSCPALCRHPRLGLRIKHGLPGIGERSDAVLRTAMPGNDERCNL